MRYWIGIDPGLSGAVALIPNKGLPWVEDMPAMAYSATGFVKRALDAHAFARLLRPLCGALELQPIVSTVFLERVNAFPGQGVASMFSLGMSYWGAFSVVAALGIPIQLVESKDWKKFYRLEKDKSLARGMAQRLFPGVDLSRVKDHGRAEALLIAQYGRILTEGK